MDLKEKVRQRILKRDNYTCRICNQFNPELGTIEVINEETNELEIHQYYNHPSPTESIYNISLANSGYTFEISFGDCWPVFPILQVHHKRYINGRDRWDYEDEYLITLCEECHFKLHLEEEIPIYSSDGNLIEKELFNPTDSGLGRKHNCDNWVFIKKVGGGEYVISNINPKVTVVLFDGEDSDHAEVILNDFMRSFIKRYFPRYHSNKDYSI